MTYSFITGNATSAIYLALKASGLPKGSKIAVPNICCPDPVYALIWAGYVPAFIDININDYNMDVTKLESKIKEKNIKAIIAVHLFGNSCDIISIVNIAKKYNCFVLEDCAQSFGNEIQAGKLGSFGDVSVFSFGNGKTIEVGHGGSVQSNNKKIIDKIIDEYRKLNAFDSEKINKLGRRHRSIYYKLYYLGIKCRTLNILNIVYIYFFRNYYLYKLDEKTLPTINAKLVSFETDKLKRISIVDKYISNMKCNFKLPTLNNKQNILSRLTINIKDAESISKKIRDSGTPSNTMYPMLVDRFTMFFNPKDFKNSFIIKGRLLNLWIDETSVIKTQNSLKKIEINND